MNEVMENQSNAHPTQINRVATRSSSKMSFMFSGFEIQKIGVGGIVLLPSGSLGLRRSKDRCFRNYRLVFYREMSSFEKSFRCFCFEVVSLMTT